MGKEKVCMQCKSFVDGSVCPLCKSNQFAKVHQGRINILDPQKSNIAQQTGLTAKGRYAIKVR